MPRGLVTLPSGVLTISLGSLRAPLSFGRPDPPMHMNVVFYERKLLPGSPGFMFHDAFSRAGHGSPCGIFLSSPDDLFPCIGGCRLQVGGFVNDCLFSCLSLYSCSPECHACLCSCLIDSCMPVYACSRLRLCIRVVLIVLVWVCVCVVSAYFLFLHAVPYTTHLKCQDRGPRSSVRRVMGVGTIAAWQLLRLSLRLSPLRRGSCGVTACQGDAPPSVCRRR